MATVAKMSTACNLTPVDECDPTTRAGCAARMESLEQAVARLEHSNRTLTQSNRELIEAVRAGTAESKRRSAALDDLAKKLLVRDNGYKLLKDTDPNLPTIPEGEPKK